MKGFIKIFFTIIASIMLFLSTIGFVIRTTFLDKNYILEILENNNFYTTITNEIKKTVKKELHNNNDIKVINHLIDNMVDFAIQEEPIKKEINLVLNQLYSNEKIKISGEFFSEDYTKKIKDFLQDVDVNISGSGIEKTLNIVFDKAINSMDFDKYTDKLSYYFGMINNYLNYSIMICFVLSLLIFSFLIVLSKKKKIIFIVSTIVFGLLAVIVGLGINIIINTLDLSQLGQFKGLVINVKDSIANKFYYIGVVSIIISLLLISVRRSKKNSIGDEK